MDFCHHGGAAMLGAQHDAGEQNPSLEVAGAAVLDAGIREFGLNVGGDPGAVEVGESAVELGAAYHDASPASGVRLARMRSAWAAGVAGQYGSRSVMVRPLVRPAARSTSASGSGEDMTATSQVLGSRGMVSCTPFGSTVL